MGASPGRPSPPRRPPGAPGSGPPSPAAATSCWRSSPRGATRPWRRRRSSSPSHFSLCLSRRGRHRVAASPSSSVVASSGEGQAKRREEAKRSAPCRVRRCHLARPRSRRDASSRGLLLRPRRGPANDRGKGGDPGEARNLRRQEEHQVFHSSSGGHEREIEGEAEAEARGRRTSRCCDARALVDYAASSLSRRRQGQAWLISWSCCDWFRI